MPKNLISKILVSQDGSEASVVARELAAFIAKKFKAKVTAFHVVSHQLMSSELRRFSPETPEYIITRPLGQDSVTHVPRPGYDYSERAKGALSEITASFLDKGKSIVTEALSFFKEQDIPADEKLLENAEPAQAILKEAEDANDDLIVIGRSKDEEQRPHLGGVAAKVSRHSKVPILVATGGRNRISKILAPVDGSKASEKAAEYAGKLAKEVGAEVTFFHVQETSIFDYKPELSETIGKNILDKAASLAGDVKIEKKMESGHPGEKIVDVADKGDFDIIVMSGRGHSTIDHYLMGSISDHVLHYANRSILIVK